MAVTGIVVALPEELRTLTSRKLEKGAIGKINDQILVAYSGAGKPNARVAAEALVSQGVNSLISWGCAAGIVQDLKPGDLLLTQECIAADQSIVASSDDWRGVVAGKLSPLLKTCRGRLAESLQLAATTAEKQAVNQTTGAVALDMESVAIAKVAKAHALPFLIIRAIADPLDMDLPKAVVLALNEQGVVNLSKLLLYLMAHPKELPGLIKLGLNFHAAQSTLKLVAKHLDSLVICPQAI